MPPDSCARAVLVDSHLPEGIRIKTGKFRNPHQKIVEKRRDRTCLLDSTTAVVIFQAKANHPAISKMALELKGLQVQLLERRDKGSFLFFSHDVLSIVETTRLRLSRSHFHLGKQCILPIHQTTPDG